MKIKLSKSQWQSIGKQAGWMKMALEVNPIPQPAQPAQQTTSYSNFDVWQFQITGRTEYESTINFKNDQTEEDYSAIVKGDIDWEYEPAQHGGRTDPSWEGYYTILGFTITDIIVEEKPDYHIAPELLKQIRSLIDGYIENNNDDLCQKYARD